MAEDTFFERSSVLSVKLAFFGRASQVSNYRLRKSSAKKATHDCWITPYMSAFWSQPRFFGSDASMEFSPGGAPWGWTGQIKCVCLCF